MKVNFRTSDFRRRVANAADLVLRNRYFEQNPSLSEDGAALLARPGMRKFLEVGPGPIRGIFSEAGAFNGDLFVVAYETLYRVNSAGESVVLGTNLYKPDTGIVNMTAVATIGETPESLFIADGRNLFVYQDVEGFDQVMMPDDLGVIDVATIASYVIVIPAQGEDVNGRFYWIEPGEVTVDPLNFATAERSSDGLYGVKVMGDQFWLPGESSTEVWYVTGDVDDPVRRLQGVVFDRGTWQATAQVVHETMIITDADGAVFALKGGSPQRISTPDIEEQIRKAIAKQQAYLYN